VLVDSACTTSLGRLFHILTILLVKKNLRRSYLARFFCSLKSLPLVVRVGDVVKIQSINTLFLSWTECNWVQRM